MKSSCAVGTIVKLTCRNSLSPIVSLKSSPVTSSEAIVAEPAPWVVNMFSIVNEALAITLPKSPLLKNLAVGSVDTSIMQAKSVELPTLVIPLRSGRNRTFLSLPLCGTSTMAKALVVPTPGVLPYICKIASAILIRFLIKEQFSNIMVCEYCQ